MKNIVEHAYRSIIMEDMEDIEDNSEITRLNEEEAYNLFDKHLDETYSPINIETYVYSPSEVLKKVDYRIYYRLANKFFRDNNIEIWLE